MGCARPWEPRASGSSTSRQAGVLDQSGPGQSGDDTYTDTWMDAEIHKDQLMLPCTQKKNYQVNIKCMHACQVASVVSDSLRPHGL